MNRFLFLCAGALFGMNAARGQSDFPLHDAARRGDLAALQAALAEQPDLLSSKDARDNTLLHVAAAAGQLSVVELLLQRGARLEAPGEAHRTPLLAAARGGDLSVVQRLLEAGADVDARDEIGKPALFWALAEGRHQMAKLLRAHGARGDSGMMFAVVSGNVERVRAAVQENEKLAGVLDSRHRTPLHWASFSGQRAVAEILLNAGADPRAKDLDGNTPLHLTAQQGHPSVAELLIQRKAPLNALNRHSRTPLALALQHQREEVAALLRKHGATQTTPPNNIHEAIRRGDPAALQQILAADASAIGEVSDCGCLPLHHAVKWQRREMIKLLLQYKPDLKSGGADGKTPLELAESLGLADVAVLLRAEQNP